MSTDHPTGDDPTGHDPARRDADVALARRAIGLIDLTDLSDDSSADRVLHLCERARRHGTAAVCVWPDFVATAVDALAGAGVGVATVVNFPTGDERAFAVGVLTERAVADGATEIDVVLPYRSWSAGEDVRPAAVLDTVRGVTPGVMKVILETGALAADRVVDAARFAVEHGADFVKTSTGKIGVSATPAAVADMLTVITSAGRTIGLKPSGGIGSLADAAAYLRLAEDAMGTGWATPATFRFGASGLLDALLSVAGDGGPAATPSSY